MKRLVVICAVLSCLAACANSYRYEGQTFTSQEEALTAAKASNSSMLARIRPAEHHVGGTLNFYIPDKATIMERGVTRTGNPRESLIDYVAETSSIAYRTFYDALVKRASFDRVVLHYSGGEQIPAQKGEYVVYLYQPNASAAAWYFSSDVINREQLHFDTSKSDRAEKVQYWIDSIEALAKTR